MNRGTRGKESGAQRAWRRAADAERRRTETIDEVKAHFDTLLDLRDRKIAELERRLRRVADEFDLYFGPRERADFKVLVVEGTPVLRATLVAALQRKFHAYSAANGYGALEAIAAAPDLVLTALGLAHINGLDLVDHLQRLAGHIPVGVMYWPRESGALNQLKELGVNLFFQRPFRLADIVKEIEKLAKKRARQKRGYVFAVCPDAHERNALFHALNGPYRTLFTASGEVAAGMADECPDTLLVDTRVPDRPWDEIVAAFKRRREATKVVVLCDPAQAASMSDAVNVGVDELVVRPFAADALLARL